jgi:hypothetical protein
VSLSGEHPIATGFGSVSAMVSLSIEVSHACRGCGQPVAINALLPRFSCDRCGRTAELDARIWKLVLHEPLRDGPGLPATQERTASLVTDAGRFQLVYRKASGACGVCRAPIERERARAAASAYVHQCACGMRTACRAVPAELGLAGVELVREEDHELLWPPERKEAVALKCNGCGGTQSVSGATPRIFACTYCSVQCYVPDDLWSLLHPVRAIKPWVLELAEVAAHAQMPAAAKGSIQQGEQKKGEQKKGEQKKGEQKGDPTRLPRFSDTKDLVVGPDATLFAVLELESTGAPELFALDGEARVKWRKEIPKSHHGDPRLSFMSSGHVVLWCAGARSLFGIRASDGVTEAELGADKSVKGGLDLRKAVCLACDVDGTIVVGKEESGGVRFLRFAASGAGVPLWPGMAVPTPWSEDEYPATLEECSAQITGAQNVICNVGFDGTFFVAGDQAIAAFDRQGQKRYVLADAEQGVATGGPTYGSVFGDRAGVLYTFESGPTLRRYVQGRRSKPYLHAEDESGLLSSETVAAVGPDGTVWVGGADGVLRRFGPSRTLEWASGGARKVDRDRADEE